MLRKALGIGMLAFSFVVACGVRASAQDDQTTWRQFVADLKADRIAAGDLRPMVASTQDAMVGFLKKLRENADWKQWEVTPQVYHVGRVVHFVLPLGTRDFCFSFIEERGRYHLHHFESIVLRLDRLPPLPLSTFPDLPEDQKAFMRQESYWTSMVSLYQWFVKEKGREAALGLFRDGDGYALAARAWVPFFDPARAFILYLGWEQSRLQGNGVTLERLTDNDAIVRLDPIFLRLYTVTGHLRTQIQEADYRGIFETMWQDRARAAGWNVSITYEPPGCTLRFTRRTPPTQ